MYRDAISLLTSAGCYFNNKFLAIHADGGMFLEYDTNNFCYKIKSENIFKDIKKDSILAEAVVKVKEFFYFILGNGWKIYEYNTITKELHEYGNDLLAPSYEYIASNALVYDNNLWIFPAKVTDGVRRFNLTSKTIEIYPPITSINDFTKNSFYVKGVVDDYRYRSAIYGTSYIVNFNMKEERWSVDSLNNGEKIGGYTFSKGDHWITLLQEGRIAKQPLNKSIEILDPPSEYKYLLKENMRFIANFQKKIIFMPISDKRMFCLDKEDIRFEQIYFPPNFRRIISGRWRPDYNDFIYDDMGNGIFAPFSVNYFIKYIQDLDEFQFYSSNFSEQDSYNCFKRKYIENEGLIKEDNMYKLNRFLKFV